MAINLNNQIINGCLLQSIAKEFGVFETVNGNWIQTLCESQGITEPLNGSWLYTFVYYASIGSEKYNPEVGFQVINGDLWQTLWYYLDGEEILANNFGILGVDYAINGSWINNTYQILAIQNTPPPPPIGSINAFGYDSSILNNGTVYSGFGVVANTITGSGSGAQFQVNILGSNWVQVVLLIGGNGYQAGDVLEIPVGAGGVLLEPISITVGDVIPE